MQIETAELSRRSMQGFTLVEGLLAMFLIAVGVLAVAPLFVQATEGNAVGADFGQASALAVERMELLRAQPYPTLAVGGDLTFDVAGYFDASDPDYIVRWRVGANPDLPGTKIVVVRAIALRQVVGQQKEVSLTTLRAR